MEFIYQRGHYNMITYAEIKRNSLEKGLEVSQIEKDYLLGWILAGISRDEKLSESWLFKGGTCLRKCFLKIIDIAKIWILQP